MSNLVRNQEDRLCPGTDHLIEGHLNRYIILLGLLDMQTNHKEFPCALGNPMIKVHEQNKWAKHDMAKSIKNIIGATKRGKHFKLSKFMQLSTTWFGWRGDLKILFKIFTHGVYYLAMSFIGS